jgi:hypothetical protein
VSTRFSNINHLTSSNNNNNSYRNNHLCSSTLIAMSPFVEDSFLSTLFDPASTAMPSDTPGFVGDQYYYDSLFAQPQSSSSSSLLPVNSASSCLPRSSSPTAAAAAATTTSLSPTYAAAAAASAAAAAVSTADWSELPSDMVESLVNYLSNDDGSTPSLSGSPVTSPDSMFGGSISPSFALNNDWWSSFSSPLDNARSSSIDNFGVVPNSAFAMAHAQQHQHQQQHRPQTLLQVPQFSTQPPLPLSPVIHNDISPVLSSTLIGKTDDMPVVEPLRGKRVSFKLTADADAEILSNKEFYARIREPEVCALLVRKSHPVFSSLDDAVGSFYILKDVRARKPPLIDAEKFNCHTRRDAGDAHWQYNVPGTDFTCRVTQWQCQSHLESATYTSYHYYRSPTPRRGTSRYSPY